MDITKISPVSFSAETDAQNLNTSIDDVMKNALSKLMAESYLEKSDVLESIANPVTVRIRKSYLNIRNGFSNITLIFR